MIVIMLIPVALAIAAGFEPMKWTVTYSWGNSIITSEVKSFTVNPPLIIFLGALVYGLFRNNLAFRAASAVSFLYIFLIF
ncbi:MAG: hypothetical protein ACOX86_00170 [Pelotomaculaceae bacterium]|uniref:Uncharacterized protein n=1 Tax=anaerobic digester metagenome TaxID=1263854 RepID=A0A485M7E4_9ZZZZ|nr:hypothetical protein [Bacillota bacterium]HHU87464.1 hypothetical protein [Peptococcaceae bacterium]